MDGISNMSMTHLSIVQEATAANSFILKMYQSDLSKSKLTFTNKIKTTYNQ